MPTMPNVVGIDYYAALLVLEQAGVLNPAAIGYFTTFPVSILWQTSPAKPSFVIGQSVAANTPVAVNSNLVLTVAAFPMGVVSP